MVYSLLSIVTTCFMDQNLHSYIKENLNIPELLIENFTFHPFYCTPLFQLIECTTLVTQSPDEVNTATN